MYTKFQVKTILLHTNTVDIPILTLLTPNTPQTIIHRNHTSSNIALIKLTFFPFSDEPIKGNATVQMVQYSPETNQPITTLKSLKEPSDDDHSSLQSQR